MDSTAQEEAARLAEAGIHIVGDEAPEVRAECMRIARRLMAERTKVIGFIPARDTVGVPAVAIQLGRALVELSGATAAYVDANVRYPALSELSSEPGEGEGDAESVFSTRWLQGSLALLTPRKAERAGEAVPALAQLLLDGEKLFEHVLVDLTGFELLGEHASAAACMDGVVLVGRAHETREKDVLQFVNEMPQSRFLGVLLVG
jgi:hypothetical protein